MCEALIAIFFIAVFGLLIIAWRLLKRYDLRKFKELKETLLGDSIDIKKDLELGEVKNNYSNKSF